MSEGGLRQSVVHYVSISFYKERSCRPSIVTDELVSKKNEKIRENRRSTISQLSLHFPQIARRLLHGIVKDKLLFSASKNLITDRTSQQLAEYSIAAQF